MRSRSSSPAPTRRTQRDSGTDADLEAAIELPGDTQKLELRPGGACAGIQPVLLTAQARHDLERGIRIQARARARRVPYLATLATAAAGFAATGLGALVAVPGAVDAVACTLCTAALSAASVGALRLRYRSGIAERWRRHWWTAGGAAAAWTTTAAVVGADNWIMSALLVAGAASAAAPWMREHQIPDPDPDQTIAPIHEAVPSAAAMYEQRWEAYIGSRGGVLPGGELTRREELPRAIRWIVETPPGSTDFDAVLARRGRLAGGLRIPGRALLLEPSEDDESSFILTVITHDSLRDGVPYNGPRYQDGQITVGDFADGTGEALYYAHDAVGCRNGLATGEPGSGKSAFLESIALALRASGEWQVWFGDGDPEGGSSPLLNELANWPEAGPRRVLAQLEGVEAAIEIRSLLKGTLTTGPDGTPIPITDPAAQRPIRELRPCTAYNGICWVLDELHRLTSDEWLKKRGFVNRLERVVRIGRKYGVVVLAGTQSLLAPDFGSSTALRGMLAARNLFAFRNSNKNEKAVVHGLTIAPGALPPGGGYAFATNSGRLAMLRVAWSPDMADWATDLPAATLDPDTAMSIAALRPAAPRDAGAELADRLARLAEWRAGQVGAAADVVEDRSTVLPELAGLAVPEGLTGANVIPLRQPHVSSAPPAARDDGPDLDILTGKQLAVLRALLAGHERSGEIVRRTGLKAPAVSKALSALADLGLARRLEHGWWRAVSVAEGSAG